MTLRTDWRAGSVPFPYSLQNVDGQSFVTSTLNQPPNANLQHATDTPLAAGAQVGVRGVDAKCRCIR